jgi:aminopeptidase N
MKHPFSTLLSLFSLVAFLLVNRTAMADPYPIDSNVDILHYRFALRFLDHTDQIEGYATLQVRWRGGGPRQLRLDLVNALAETGHKGMVVDSVSINGRNIAFRHEQNALLIRGDNSGIPGDVTEITIRYHGIPADGLHPGSNKFGERGFFSDNWPDKTRHWLPVIDHPHEKATCEFLVKAPSHYQVVSNGLLKEKRVIDDSTTFTYWKQSVPIASWLYTIGVSTFAVQELEPFKGKPIQSWVYERERAAGFRDLESPTKEVLRYFSDYIGPFAYEKIANIESPVVGGGMEAASAIGYSEKLIDGTQSKRIRNVVIHELAHQWFGNAVTERSWDDAWLSESFATYFTLQFIRHAYGEEEYQDELKKARSLFERHLKNEAPYPIVASRSPEMGPVTNYAVTYQKGAWVLTMLQDMMGKTAFRKGIREYYQQFYNDNATTADFKAIMQKHAHTDLGPFFTQWLTLPGQIEANYSWSYDPGKRRVTLTIEQPAANPYQFNLELSIAGTGKTITRSLAISLPKTIISIPCTFRPESVVLDPRGKLLAAFQQMQ